MILLATLRGIPQMLYGEEYNLHSKDLSRGHSTLRMPMPAADRLTDENKDMQAFVSKLFQWRKKETVLHTGKTMHFLDRQNTYAFFRYTDKEAVFVFTNAADHYAEILNRYNPVGQDVMTGKQTDLSRLDIVVPPLGAVVVKLRKR